MIESSKKEVFLISPFLLNWFNKKTKIDFVMLRSCLKVLLFVMNLIQVLYYTNFKGSLTISAKETKSCFLLDLVNRYEM